MTEDPEDVSRLIRWLKRLGGEPELIDKWVERNVKGTGATCLTNDVTVIFPSGCRKGEETPRGPREMNCAEAVQRIVDAMTVAFGGTTSWRGYGTWVGDSVVGEDVAVIQSGHHCTDKEKARKFVETVKDVGLKTKQEALSIRGTNKFIIVDPEKIKRL